MSATGRVYYADAVFEGESRLFKALVRNPDTGTNLLAADVQSIYVRVFDLEASDLSLPVYEDAPDIASSWSDTLLTTGWDFSEGYNLKLFIPGDQFTTEGGHTYRIQIEIQHTYGPTNFIVHLPVESKW